MFVIWGTLLLVIPSSVAFFGIVRLKALRGKHKKEWIALYYDLHNDPELLETWRILSNMRNW